MPPKKMDARVAALETRMEILELRMQEMQAKAAVNHEQLVALLTHAKDVTHDDALGVKQILQNDKSGSGEFSLAFKSLQGDALEEFRGSVNKVELPMFSGEDPAGGIARPEAYFRVQDTRPEVKVNLAQLTGKEAGSGQSRDFRSAFNSESPKISPRQATPIAGSLETALRVLSLLEKKVNKSPWERTSRDRILLKEEEIVQMMMARLRDKPSPPPEPPDIGALVATLLLPGPPPKPPDPPPDWAVSHMKPSSRLTGSNGFLKKVRRVGGVVYQLGPTLTLVGLAQMKDSIHYNSNQRQRPLSPIQDKMGLIRDFLNQTQIFLGNEIHQGGSHVVVRVSRDLFNVLKAIAGDAFVDLDERVVAKLSDERSWCNCLPVLLLKHPSKLAQELEKKGLHVTVSCELDHFLVTRIWASERRAIEWEIDQTIENIFVRNELNLIASVEVRPNTFLLHLELFNFTIIAILVPLFHGPSPRPNYRSPLINAAMDQDNSLVGSVGCKLLLTVITHPSSPFNRKINFISFYESRGSVLQRGGSAAALVVFPFNCLDSSGVEGPRSSIEGSNLHVLLVFIHYRNCVVDAIMKWVFRMTCNYGSHADKHYENATRQLDWKEFSMTLSRKW